MKVGWARAVVTGCVASFVALALQGVLRDRWQIRSLPERVMEWLLLFVPLDLFERALAQLGSDAKSAALAATLGGMAVFLATIGVAVLRAGWGSWRLVGLGFGLWLATMVGIMPITGAGVFATRLVVSPWLTSAGHLLVFLGYACVLVAGRLLSMPGLEHRSRILAERRALLAGLAGSAAAGVLAGVFGRDGGLVSSTLPLASAPPAREPTLHAAVPATAPTPGEAPPTDVPPTPASAPTAEPLPNPPPPRQLTRDRDGSITAAGRRKGELAPAITSNDDFFVVTKNAVADPIVDAASWRLVIDGEVNRPVQVDYRTLRSLPAIEVTKTLECISNFTAACHLTAFGCELISTARWKGARLADVLALAGGLKSTTAGLAFIALDEFSSGLPREVADDPETLIAYEMNNQPLPREHGFPARLLVPGRYGMKDPKWIAAIQAVRQEYAGWYEQRNWNKDGIVKTMSRIDVPMDEAMLTPGDHRLAGIAYAGDRGVQHVEFSTDDGTTWSATRLLEPMPGRDAMVRWEATFSLRPGVHITLTARTTDGTGAIQTEYFQLPQPDGASGWHQITVSG